MSKSNCFIHGKCYSIFTLNTDGCLIVEIDRVIWNWGIPYRGSCLERQKWSWVGFELCWNGYSNNIYLIFLARWSLATFSWWMKLCELECPLLKAELGLLSLTVVSSGSAPWNVFKKPTQRCSFLSRSGFAQQRKLLCCNEQPLFGKHGHSKY